MSSHISREDEETCSNRATSGSSDIGSDDLGSTHTGLLSSEPRPQRPMTRRFLQDLHASTGRAAREISSLGSSSLRGLTPPPLPPAMLPSKKRSLGEVLGDESPPEKDKMSVEIDQLAGGGPSRPHALAAGPSGTQSVMSIQSHRRKKSKASGEELTFRMPPRGTRGSAMDSDGPGDKSPERRSERVYDASRVGNRETSS
ncbi:hypothetical protein O1611_g1905 [Lasiodiplodia mahajangana]|uniref:Uncharacterized protein n=1 Tax=Lasiodiplodia mahajangana TaxID=1108764 RepID=A0ACC2JW25_9PEZI|nr:hypothetical protein O1611_g1905 [Lasiodiplodia mahajangana]